MHHQEVHVNRCLDEQQLLPCPVCQQRFRPPIHAHVNACFEKLMSSKDIHHVDYKCLICQQSLSIGLSLRIRHLKQCGTRHGVRAIHLNPEEPAPEDPKLPVPFREKPANAFDLLMSRKPAMTAPTPKRRFPGASSGASCPSFKVIRGSSPPVIVDGFQYASKYLSSVYFLSHFHSDHYQGLTQVRPPPSPPL
jgi:hypothetical protein